jgi:hypothetical protein
LKPQVSAGAGTFLAGDAFCETLGATREEENAMQTRQLIVFLALSLLAAVVVVGAVTAYQRSQSEVLVDTPAVRVETNKATGETKIDAPFAHVEKDSEGTHIDAPGVKVETPKPPSE